MNKFYIKNIELDRDVYTVNKYISLKRSSRKNEETIVEIDDREELWENNLPLFYRALQICLSRVHIDAYANEQEGNLTYNLIKDLSTCMINYYSPKEDLLIIFQYKMKLTKENIENLSHVFNIVVEYNKQKIEERENSSWEATRWTYAYNQYINSCGSMSIEISILNIITGLESLLVKGNGELTYRVALYSSLIIGNTIEERKTIYKLVKWMYDLRSKVVHGEVKEVTKKLSSEELYIKYFALKDLFSKILIKVYGMDEDALFSKIENVLFNSPKFQ